MTHMEVAGGYVKQNGSCQGRHFPRFALSVLYGSQNRQRLLLYALLTDRFFITVVKSVYCAVRTDYLYKAGMFSL